MNTEQPFAREGAAESRPAPLCALSIAGFDPASGAGITADLKTFAAYELFGASAITALTVQSTRGVFRVQPVEAGLVQETLDRLIEDLPIAGLKIGMLASEANVAVVCDFLERNLMDRQRVVLDPVLRSSSGAELIETGGLQLMRDRLLGRVGWITPNLAELAALNGEAALDREAIPDAARRLRDSAARMGNEELHVVVTGGHLPEPDDFLLGSLVRQDRNADEGWIAGERVVTRATHGTGCAFSSALLAELLGGKEGLAAVAGAKAYVAAAMRAAYPMGAGKGPLHHLHALIASEGRPDEL